MFGTCSRHHMGVSQNRGVSPNWMVKLMENPMAKWDDWGGNPTIFSETTICKANPRR